MISFNHLSVKQLRQAAELKEQINDLEQDLAKILGGKSAPFASTPSDKPARKKHKMSAAGRKAIAAAQKARWAKVKAGKK